MTQALNGGLGERTGTSGYSGAVRLRAAPAALGLLALMAGCGGSSEGRGGGSSKYDDGMSGSPTGTGQGSEAVQPRGSGVGGDEGSSTERDGSEGDNDRGSSGDGGSQSGGGSSGGGSGSGGNGGGGSGGGGY